MCVCVCVGSVVEVTGVRWIGSIERGPNEVTGGLVRRKDENGGRKEFFVGH